jgi:hypothetical protein
VLDPLGETPPFELGQQTELAELSKGRHSSEM